MKDNIMQKIGIFSFSLLLAMTAAYLYSPVIKSHADETEEVEVNAEIDSIISVNASDVELEMDSDRFATGTATVYVDSNSGYGYSLYIEDLDEDSSMKNQTDNSYTISSTFTGTKTSSTMEKNTWGYSMDGADFSKIPVFGNPTRIKTTNSGSTDNVSVSFGAKVGQTLASGYYVDHILFSAVANGQDGSSAEYTGSTTMQEFVCKNVINPSDFSEIDTEYTGYSNKYIQKWHLRDTRNNKVYEVAQLSDGNCWMIQNLDISGQEITKDNSALHSKDNFTIPSSLTTWSFSYTNPEVYSTNNASTGAYYNYATASAGYDTYSYEYTSSYGSTYTNYRSGSICPSGWKLPTYSDFSDILSKAFTYEQMLQIEQSVYEIRNLERNGGDETEIANKKNELTSMVMPIIESSPANFTKNGMYSVDENGLTGQGTIGAWWTSHDDSNPDTESQNVFMIGGSFESMLSSYEIDTRNGVNVRCMAENEDKPTRGR
jgi:uncharacterized protein (TIGR02145 family)